MEKTVSAALFTRDRTFGTISKVTPGGVLLKFMEKPSNQAISANPAKFVREVVSELKKVTWPTREETLKLTAVVVAISVIVGAFIGGLDAIFVKTAALLY